jgi:crotonobetainyl-CoA:carnitine CoA-transferase CaiB-like acyl-CoA transferase
VLADLTGEEIEKRAAEHGALAFAVRSPETWESTAQGRAARPAGPLTVPRTDAGPRPPLGAAPAGPLLPAAGVRVLDLTRVIAGPVATRTLALLGADVLRVDPPGLPEIPGQHLDTGTGKRSALLDLATPAGRERLEALLAEADVVVTGYRPDALGAFGLDPDALRERHPGLVTARLSAWGTGGPWARRRGFDSLVQAACGIARIEADGEEPPGALPAQALDHGTGYLLAAGVLRGLAMRQADGRGTHVEAALARTAAWLTGHHDPDERRPRMPARTAPGPWLGTFATPYGELTHALPAFTLDGGPRTWARPPARWGGDEPRWLSRS